MIPLIVHYPKYPQIRKIIRDRGCDRYLLINMCAPPGGVTVLLLDQNAPPQKGTSIAATIYDFNAYQLQKTDVPVVEKSGVSPPNPDPYYYPYGDGGTGYGGILDVLLSSKNPRFMANKNP